MRASYGFDKISYDDELVHDAEKLLSMFSEVVVPGRYLVNHIPILRHLPAWCPGGAAQRFASKYRPFFNDLKNEPFNAVKADMIRTQPSRDDRTSINVDFQRREVYTRIE